MAYINKEDLLTTINEVYDRKYAKCNWKPLYDLYRMFIRRINRATVANSVLVPPCQVGDTVYCIERKTIYDGIVKMVKSITDEAGTKYFVQVECEIEDPFYDDKRKIKHGISAVWGMEWGGWNRAFSTYEEAEMALKERGAS